MTWTGADVRFWLSWWWELAGYTLPRRGWLRLSRPPRRRSWTDPSLRAAELRADLTRALDALDHAWPKAARAVRVYYCDPQVRHEHHLVRLAAAAGAALGDPSLVAEAWALLREGTDQMAAFLNGQTP